MATEIEVIRKFEVWNNNHGARVVVCPDPDGSDNVVVSVNDQHSRDYLGECSLLLDPEFALALAAAIVDVARDVKASAQRSVEEVDGG